MSALRRFRVVRDAAGRPHLHDVDAKQPTVVPETRVAPATPAQSDPRTLTQQLAPPYGGAA